MTPKQREILKLLWERYIPMPEVNKMKGAKDETYEGAES